MSLTLSLAPKSLTLVQELLVKKHYEQFIKKKIIVFTSSNVKMNPVILTSVNDLIQTLYIIADLYWHSNFNFIQ